MSQIEVSVIIPFCNEGPNVVFTTQAIIEELDGFCKYEVILIDNMSHDYIMHKTGDREYPVRSRAYFFSPKKQTRISTMFFRKGLVKYFQYDEAQSHWRAKNYGIQNNTGKYLFFLDAHCIMRRDSLRKMVQFLRDNEGQTYTHPMAPGKTWQVGSVHAYINYMMDSRSLEYKVQSKTFGYQFCTHQQEEYFENGQRMLRFPTKPYPVCVMSTCGMLTPRSIFDKLGLWPENIEIYSGGESYANWTQATCGYEQWIHPEAWCWHWAEKRGYCFNHHSLVKNSFIAAYVIGGEKYLSEQVQHRCEKDRPEYINQIADEVRSENAEDRKRIQSQQLVDYDTYIEWWLKHPGTWK